MQVRRAAAAQGVSVSAFIARTLDDALKRRKPAEPPRPFRLITVDGDGPRTGIDLDRSRAIRLTTKLASRVEVPERHVAAGRQRVVYAHRKDSIPSHAEYAERPA